MKRSDFIKAALFSLPFMVQSNKAQATSLPHQYHPSDIRNFGNDPLKAIEATGEAYFPLGRHELNSLKLSKGKIFGPGTIVKAKQAKEALLLSGQVHIDGLTFSSAEDRRDGHCEIRLGENLQFAIISTCHFNGNCYAAISADQNGQDDHSLKYASPAKNIKIVLNHIEGAYSRHLYLHSVENLLVQANTFKQSKRDSIRLRQACRRVQILANSFEDIGTLKVDNIPESADALDTYWSGEEFVFSHNILKNVAIHGLDIKGLSPKNDYGSQHFIISENQISQCGWHGVSISAAEIKDSQHSLEHLIIDNNLISKCNQLKRDKDAAALMLWGPLSFASVCGNHLFDNNGRGLMLNNRDVKLPINRNIRIQGNLARANRIGILIYPCDGLILKDNICVQDKQQPYGLIIHKQDRVFKMSRFQEGGNLSS